MFKIYIYLYIFYILAKFKFPGYRTVQTMHFSTHQNGNLLTASSGQAKKFSLIETDKK